MCHIFLKYGKIFHWPCFPSSSNNYFPIMSWMADCEASAIYLCPIDSKLLGHLFMSKWLPHDKFQLNFPSKYSWAIFQSSCLRESVVKEVLARHIQMSWNFARSFIWSNHHSPPNFSSCNSSMWSQLQILVSSQIFSLWSNYILCWFI